jgi:AcrR family transcriptional regulator
MDQSIGLAPVPDTRARILDAAVRTFGDRGFHGTSTRKITKTSGLSAAALYVHHRSKEELLFEISRAGHEETLEVVTQAVSETSDPVEQLRRLMHGYVLFHTKKHTLARVINYEMSALTPEHRAEIKKIRRQIDFTILEVVAAGVDAGLFETADPRMTAIALESMGIDIARWYSDRGTWKPEQIATRYVEMAMRLVGVAPSQREG